MITRESLRAAVAAMLVVRTSDDDLPEVAIMLPTDAPADMASIGGVFGMPDAAERYRALLVESIATTLANKLGLEDTRPLHDIMPQDVATFCYAVRTALHKAGQDDEADVALRVCRQHKPATIEAARGLLWAIVEPVLAILPSDIVALVKGFPVPVAAVEADAEPECAGTGKCHGCLKWCSTCGDVAHICDTRLRGERCDEHPVPTAAIIVRFARRAAEEKIARGREMLREGERELAEVVDAENARRAYDRQMVEAEAKSMEAP